MKKISVSSYFIAVDRRMGSDLSPFFHLTICIESKILRFYFQIRDQFEYTKRLFHGLLDTCDSRTADAEFFCWTSDLTDYLPTNAETTGVWFSQDETGYLHIMSDYGLRGADYTRNRYYSCLSNTFKKSGKIYCFEPLTLLFRWAWQSDRMLIHGAAVGLGGKGVLLGGRGGAGKSTLAIACQMRGMDFVADDYVLLNRQGSLCAMPLFHTIKLNSDMQELLQVDLPVIHTENADQKRLLLDASEMNLCKSLELHGIVLPRKSESNEIHIELVSSGKAITQIVHSSLTQFDVAHDLSIVKTMLDRLKILPVYEMTLSHNPGENAYYLETFMKQML